MATPSKNMDRRAQRTRQLLREAFIEVAREKGVTAASIQDITDRANVSRGTFYAHYTDKYALVETIVREEFQAKLAALPLEAGWGRENLCLLIKATLEYFKAVYQLHQRSAEIGPILERAIHDELNTLLLNWLKARERSAPQHVPAETAAQVMSWGIFGGALQWSRDYRALPAEQMAAHILTLLLDKFE